MQIQSHPYGNLKTTWIDGTVVDRYGRLKPYVGITTINSMLVDYVWRYPDPGWPGGVRYNAAVNKSAGLMIIIAVGIALWFYILKGENYD